jgi:peptide/nickel transport system substrate-binding protein
MESCITHHQAAVRIFTQELPVIPLFARVKTAVTLPTLLNFQLDSTQPSELWNIAELDTEVIGNQ